MALRVNIRKLKQLLWFSGVLAFAYAGWTFYDIYSAKQAGEYTARKLKVFEDILKRDMNEASRNKHKAAVYPPTRYDKVWLALVNGEVRKGPEEDVDDGPIEPAAPVVPPLADVIDISTVLSTAVTSRRRSSCAARPRARRRSRTRSGRRST